jgi:SCO1/SenC family protein
MSACGALLVAGLLLAACARDAGQPMPPFAATDQSGTTVRSESFHGYALVVSFVFTRCTDACPLVTAQLTRVQAGSAPRVSLGARASSPSLSIPRPTPWTSCAATCRASASTSAPGRFLTGAPEEVERVVGSLVVFVDAQGRIAQCRTDLELDADPLVAARAPGLMRPRWTVHRRLLPATAKAGPFECPPNGHVPATSVAFADSVGSRAIARTANPRPDDASLRHALCGLAVRRR